MDSFSPFCHFQEVQPSMPRRSRKTPYESYRNGQWTLLGMTAITAVNLLLAAFSFGLFFPLSAWIPRDLLLRGHAAAGAASTAFYFSCGLLFCCYAACTFLSYRKDRASALAMRAALLLYAADTAYYFVLSALPTIVSSGFRPANVIELLFRGFALYQFYRADSVSRDPNRDNPHLRIEEPEVSPEEEDDDDEEDEEDEGIQW